jgi:hypothetical protein
MGWQAKILLRDVARCVGSVMQQKARAMPYQKLAAHKYRIGADLERIGPGATGRTAMPRRNSLGSA